MAANERANFGSKIGIILASAGSAVGLGNIWRFPYLTGEDGGAAFILVYICCVLFLGIPAMVAEFVVGRHSRANTGQAYDVLAPGTPWKLVGLMGVLGIGLPDVPIFLAAVFKTLFEISLRFGYPYNTRQEQLYQMLVICAAVGEPADRRRAATDLNLLARELQIGAGVSFSWEETKRRAAKALCSAALTGKVVQGVPIVGVYGGFRNGVLLRQIGSMAAVKYQQRLLSF